MRPLPSFLQYQAPLSHLAVSSSTCLIVPVTMTNLFKDVGDMPNIDHDIG